MGNAVLPSSNLYNDQISFNEQFIYICMFYFRSQFVIEFSFHDLCQIPEMIWRFLEEIMSMYKNMLID